MNNLSIIGNLVKDLEVRQTTSGLQIYNGVIAVNDKVKKGDQYVDEPSFFTFTMIGDRWIKVSQYLTKGVKIGISGKLKQRRWEDNQTGQKRSVVEITVFDLTLLPKSDKPSYSQNKPVEPVSQAGMNEFATSNNTIQDDDSIPF